MEIIKLKLEEIHLYSKNAKLHPDEQIKQIKDSIIEFGFNDPIAIDEDNIIIEGNGRYKALTGLKEEGYEEINYNEIPCIRLTGLNQEQKKAYILVHNKLTMNTDFDLELLQEELKDIINIDMEQFDFNLDFLDEEEAEPEEDNFDVDSAIPEEPVSKLGDIYQLGNHRLMCGDSTKAEDVQKLMNGELADMVFTDPPWNVNYGAMEEGNPQGYKPRTILNDFMGTEDFKTFMYNAFNCMNKASKEGCMTYVVMSAQEWGNMMLTLGQNEYHWSSTIIWNKDHLVLSRKDYHTKYEPIWYGWKEGASRLCPLEDRKQSDVWDFDRPTKSEEHPTMKPVGLVAHAIKNSSKKNNIILDLFGGSGTTLIASEQTNRFCRMMELDPHYVDVIIQRWEELTGKKAVKLND